MSVQIIVDSACDLSKEEAKELNIRVLPLKTYFGETEYLDGVTLSQQEFFEKLIESDVLPTTSQVSPYEFEEAYKEAIDAGNEIICITVSGKLSGTNQSAHIAADEYENKVYVVDIGTENAKFVAECYSVAPWNAGYKKEDISNKEATCSVNGLLELNEWLNQEHKKFIEKATSTLH